MEKKLQELTDKLYREGIDKAKQEEKEILDKAQAEAGKIVEDAEKKSKEIISKAKEEAEQLRKKTMSEIDSASSQAVSSLKQKISDLLSKASLEDSVKAASKDSEFIKEIVSQIVTNWSPDQGNIDFEAVLPEKQKKELESYFKSKAKKILDAGLEITFDERMEGGFKIQPKDHTYVLTFTEKEFNSFFQSFLKQRTKEILFSGE